MNSKMNLVSRTVRFLIFVSFDCSGYIGYCCSGYDLDCDGSCWVYLIYCHDCDVVDWDDCVGSVGSSTAHGFDAV